VKGLAEDLRAERAKNCSLQDRVRELEQVKNRQKKGQKLIL
jgi:hypothetical protein